MKSGQELLQTKMAATNNISCSYFAAVIVQCMNVQILEEMLQVIL